MLCEKCKKNTATVHYRYSENGNVTELHLCPECAKNEGLMQNNGSAAAGFMSQGGIFEDYFGKAPFSALFGNTLLGKQLSVKQRVCPGCGLSDGELRSGGRLGCAQCYTTFEDIVELMLKKMHQSCEYKGKTPEGTPEGMSLAGKIEKLRSDMQTAVDNQEYEEAARIRDAIRQLENPTDENNGDNGGDR